ncbi:MAG TPA: proline iminopeptidase-family hydrolase [Dehalococcoidia bacterium]|nr:proline iminopeptidase-family hydrolase [Dehalococcoidia bacterium]
MTTEVESEGRVAVPGGNVWYRITGGGPGVPLLVLHGGPGSGHDYLEPLEALGDERPVVFYDQLGCGRSDIPDDASLWVVERFAREVQAVREGLGLERVHLYGQSWGGFLAIEYLTDRPEGVVSAVLANTAASSKAFEREARLRVAELPPATQSAIETCEAGADYESAEYRAATIEYYQRFVCRSLPWPDFVTRTVANSEASPTYKYMWGPSEFTMTGTLASWDRTADLGKIEVPTLVICGEHDEAAPSLSEEIHRGVAGSELAVIPDASHLMHIERPEAVFARVREFLARAEAA